MPSIGNKIPRKRKIEGYKVAIKDGGRYRSIYSWHVYQAGKHIAKFKFIRKNEDVNNVPFPLQKHIWFCYDEKYNGYTSIFKNLKDANLSNVGISEMWLQTINQKIVVLKMILSDDLREKVYGDNQIFIGKKIEEITEIKILHSGN